MENVLLSPIPLDSFKEMIREAIKEEIRATGPVDKTTTPGKPLTMAELADHLGVTVQTICRKMKAGKIPYFRIGTSVRFDLEKVLKSLEKK